MTSNPNQIAAIALSGFTDAESYDAHRPSYPAAAVDNLLKQIKLEGIKGARILDLAAGTGKFTELLAQRPENYEILAVEPHSEMRAQLQKKQTERGWNNVKIEEGFADSMSGVPDSWADAVVVAQVSSLAIYFPICCYSPRLSRRTPTRVQPVGSPAHLLKR